MTDREQALWDAALAFVGGRYWPPHDPKAIARALLEAKAEALHGVWKDDGWRSPKTGQPASVPLELGEWLIQRAAEYEAAAKGGGDVLSERANALEAEGKEPVFDLRYFRKRAKNLAQRPQSASPFNRGPSMDPGYCVYPVHDGIIDFNQCSRKPKERVGRFGFCRQHASMIRIRKTEAERRGGRDPHR